MNKNQIRSQSAQEATKIHELERKLQSPLNERLDDILEAKTFAVIYALTTCLLEEDYEIDDCITDDELHLMQAGQACEPDKTIWFAHIEECSTCKTRLFGTRRDHAERTTPFDML